MVSSFWLKSSLNPSNSSTIMEVPETEISAVVELSSKDIFKTPNSITLNG
jgi:hypothetical protein